MKQESDIINICSKINLIQQRSTDGELFSYNVFWVKKKYIICHEKQFNQNVFEISCKSLFLFIFIPVFNFPVKIELVSFIRDYSEERIIGKNRLSESKENKL